MVTVTVENEENDKYDLRIEFPVILWVTMGGQWILIPRKVSTQ